MPPTASPPPGPSEQVPTAIPLPAGNDSIPAANPLPPPLSSPARPPAQPIPVDDSLLPPPIAAPIGDPSEPGLASPLPLRPESRVATSTSAARPILVESGPTEAYGVEDEDSDEYDEEDLESDVIDRAQRAAPPWIVSLVFHTVVLIVLGLLLLPNLFEETMQLEVIYAEKLGEQVEDDIFQSPDSEEMDIIEPVLSEDDVPVEDPFAAPPEVLEITDPIDATSQMDAPSIGLALTGREKGMKKALLAAYGGTALTEEAVIRGLEWLKRNQKKDGSWSLSGPYANAGTQENRIAATAMALLAFQGNGSTHQSGPYKEQVARGWTYLLKQQDAEGGFVARGVPLHHSLYSQAQAMIALCELYGMTRDSQLRPAAIKAVAYAVKYQDAAGGWRYTPGSDSDISVTGWFVMGLQSALMSGLEVPQETLYKIEEYLDVCTTDGGAQYSYRPNTVAKISMTAEALLARQYLGWAHNDPRLNRGVQVVGASPVNYDRQNVYYWYYATQVMHHMGGRPWSDWNKVMRQAVPEQQIKTGDERGSWSPGNDQWGQHGGRLFTTCLSIYMLEVYYRHLPIYTHGLK
jgi:hypothetical protein